MKCSSDVKSYLSDIILELNADMGGTEIFRALDSALERRLASNGVILLITDGLVWRDEIYLHSLINRACAQDIKIFAIGVGDNINTSALNELTSKTGGRLHLSHPFEAMQQLISNVVKQIFMPYSDFTVEWPVKPYWEYSHGHLYSKESLVIQSIHQNSVSSFSLSILGGSSVVKKVANLPDHYKAKTKHLAQWIMHRKVRASDKERALSLALEYDLLTPLTDFVMVNNKVIHDADGLPKIIEVRHMLPQNKGSQSYSGGVDRSLHTNILQGKQRSKRSSFGSNGPYCDAQDEESECFLEFLNLKGGSLDSASATTFDFFKPQLDLENLEYFMFVNEKPFEELNFELLDMANYSIDALSALAIILRNFQKEFGTIATEPDFVARFILAYVIQNSEILPIKVRRLLSIKIGAIAMFPENKSYVDSFDKQFKCHFIKKMASKSNSV